VDTSRDAEVGQPIFSVIVPCYNERDGIGNTVDILRDELRNAGEYELLVVDDGSSDGSSAILDTIAAGDGGIVVLRHAINRGYGAALKTGIRNALADYIVITDADGTYPNERIPEMVERALSKKLDMVVGARTAEDARYSRLRSIPKWFLTRYASWIAGQSIPDINSGLRVFRKDTAREYMSIFPDGFSFTTTITLAMLTNNRQVVYIPIGYSPRVGKSKIRPIRDTLNFVQLIARTGMYFAPLRVILPIGNFLGLAFLVSLGFDIANGDLTEKTLLLILFAMNTIMFAMLADMIDKRSGR